MCGHLRSEHNKNFLKKPMDCNNCQCFEYLDYNRPRKSDKMMVIFGIFIICWFAGFFVFFSSFWFAFTDDELSQSAPITIGEYLLVVSALFFITCVLFCAWFYDLFIGEYFHQKRRKRQSER